MKRYKLSERVIFDLHGMKAGQEFIGCKKCGVQFNIHNSTGICFECPNCGNPMAIYAVTSPTLAVRVKS